VLVRHSRLIAAASILLLSIASAAGADVLWDQSNLNPTQLGSVDLSSNSCSPISGDTKVHVASDVHFDNPVHITTVRIYETPGPVQTATTAFLWISPKTGTLPTTRSDSLELASLQVPITPVTVGTGSSQFVRVTAIVDVELPAGDYWVSLTPRHTFGGVPPNSYHIVTTGPIVGDPSASIVACTVNSNWAYPLAPNQYDYSIKIEGEFHTPTVPLPTGVRGEAATP
jgi:hypothetical protein